MPRTKSLMGALELWGKTINLQARVGYRSELLESLAAWQPLIEHPVDGIRACFEQQLSETGREYQEHQQAFNKTLENRARRKYTELKYTLHNSRQIAEIREIAQLSYNAELLRYIHSYTSLDKPVAQEDLGREIGERWRDQILALLEVYELAGQLEGVAQICGRPIGSIQARDNSNTCQVIHDTDQQIIKGWLLGNWTMQQMRGSLACIENENTKYHAGRYIKAHEYFEAAKEIFIHYRRGAEWVITRPSMENGHVARIHNLLEQEEVVPNQEGRDLLHDLAVLVTNDQKPTAKRFERLIERTLAISSSTKEPVTRVSNVQNNLSILKPHDERWMARLSGVTKLKETEALALAMHGTSILFAIL
jgi:hypothetical protein